MQISVERKPHNRSQFTEVAGGVEYIEISVPYWRRGDRPSITLRLLSALKPETYAHIVRIPEEVFFDLLRRLTGFKTARRLEHVYQIRYTFNAEAGVMQQSGRAASPPSKNRPEITPEEEPIPREALISHLKETASALYAQGITLREVREMIKQSTLQEEGFEF